MWGEGTGELAWSRGAYGDQVTRGLTSPGRAGFVGQRYNEATPPPVRPGEQKPLPHGAGLLEQQASPHPACEGPADRKSL